MSELPRIPPAAPIAPTHPLRPSREAGREPRRQRPEQGPRRPRKIDEVAEDVIEGVADEGTRDETDADAGGATDPSGRDDAPPARSRIDLRV